MTDMPQDGIGEWMPQPRFKSASERLKRTAPSAVFLTGSANGFALIRNAWTTICRTMRFVL